MRNSTLDDVLADDGQSLRDYFTAYAGETEEAGPTDDEAGSSLEA